MMSTTCPFCGSPAIVSRMLTREFKPDYIIPFKVDTTEKATELKKKGKVNGKKSKAKSRKPKKENISPTPPEQPSVEEDPGEEPENLTPEDFVHSEHSTKNDVPGSSNVQATDNYENLMTFLNEKATKDRVPYLAGNLTETILSSWHKILLFAYKYSNWADLWWSGTP